MDMDCGCKGVDAASVNVVVFSFGPPVTLVQKLLGEECTAGRQISCTVRLQCRENRLRRNAPPICLQLKRKHFVDNQPGHPVIFDDIFKLKVTC